MQKKTPYIILINWFACHNCDFFLRCSFKPRCVSELVCFGPPLMDETAFLHLLPSVGSLSGCGYSCSAVLWWVFNSEPRYNKGVDIHKLRLFKSNKSCRLISSCSQVISCQNTICVLETSRLWTINCVLCLFDDACAMRCLQTPSRRTAEAIWQWRVPKPQQAYSALTPLTTWVCGEVSWTRSDAVTPLFFLLIKDHSSLSGWQIKMV